MSDESRQLVLDYKSVFSGPAGQRVLADLKRRCLFDRQTFDPGNQYMTAFNEGARYVAMYIDAQVNVDLSEEPQQDAISQKESTDA